MTATTKLTTRREELENLAAELMRRPVYVALQSEGVPEDIGGEKVGGVYSRRLDLALKPYLEASGRWEGRRPAVYIDDVRFEDWGCIFLHELGHLAEFGFCEVPEKVFSPALLQRDAAHWAEHRDNPVIIDETLGHEKYHGPRFVRACCHLWWRARQMGYGCNPEHIYDGDLYGVPKGWAAVDALGDEMQRMSQLWIETILILPAPKEFDALFLKENKP